MRKVSLRSLAAHKLRLVLTVFSVVLGTSFVAAALIFTATVQTAFDSIFDNVARGVAVEVTPADDNSPGVPVQVVDQLREHRGELGIDRVQVDYSGPVTIAKADGKALQTGGAPSIGSAYTPPGESIDTAGLKLVSGHAPAAPGEVVINREAAEKADLTVGQTTRVAFGAGTTEPMQVTVVGLLDMPGSTGGFTNIQFSAEQAKKLFSDGRYVSTVDMSAAAGVSDEKARDAVAALLDPDGDGRYEVRTGEQVREDEKAAVGDFLNVIQYVLLAFAAIGLIVGTFIIFNTFSMIVAQRNKELALLRAIGASRKNVARSVRTEALVVGVIGGGLGLGLGIGMAAILRAVTASSGLPTDSLTIRPAAVIAAIVVGIVVTLLSAWIPARRASRIPPVEAMRQSSAEPGGRSLRVRTGVGIGLTVAAAVLLGASAAAEGTGALWLVAGGAVALILAVVLAAPALSRPLVGGIGRLLQKPFGAVGKLARTNAVRNPRRSAATAFALTIGLILVVVIGTIGASFKAAINEGIDKELAADFVVSGNAGAPLSSAVGPALTKVPDAQTVVALDMAYATYDGDDVAAFTPVGGPLSDVINVTMKQGVLEVPEHGMLASEKSAEDEGWKVGQQVTFTSTTGTDVTVTLDGIYEESAALGNWVIGNAAFDELVPSQATRMMAAALVTGKPGVSEQSLRDQLEQAVEPFLTAQVQDRQQYKNQFSSLIDQMLVILYALLGLALVVAVLGIINTLALSVVERRREIGMLRAIGLTRRQVQGTIYLESVYISIFGALLGVVAGLTIGLPLVFALGHWGLDVVAVPWSLIVITLVGAGVVGVIAALWPAISAARTKPLEAIAEE